MVSNKSRWLKTNKILIVTSASLTNSFYSSRIMTEEKKIYLGRITGINRERGYGFILSREVPFTRIFFHWTGLHPSTINFLELEKGMEVDFELVEVEEKGQRATNIHVLEPEDKPAENKENTTNE